MKILIVSTCPTHPINAGNRKCIYNQVEILRKLGHEVYFLYIKDTPIWRFKNVAEEDELYEFWGKSLFILSISKTEHFIRGVRQRLRNIFNSGYCKVDDYYPSGLTSYVKKIQREFSFDACMVNYYYLSKLFTGIHFKYDIMLTHDYFAYKGLLMKNKYVGYSTTADEEAVAMQRTKHILALNSDEAIYFQKLSPFSTVYNIFCHYDYHENDYIGNANLLYLSGDNIYNINGLNWFLESIFPLLIDKIKDIKLYIAGGICEKLTHINHPNIVKYGYVKDPMEFFKLGDFVINPTYQGTGLKIKTFEGMSYDKVIVAHPHSVSGIYKPDTAPVFASTSAEEWYSFINGLMLNREKINEIKRRNREYMTSMNESIVREYQRLFLGK